MTKCICYTFVESQMLYKRDFGIKSKVIYISGRIVDSLQTLNNLIMIQTDTEVRVTLTYNKVKMLQ